MKLTTTATLLAACTLAFAAGAMADPLNPDPSQRAAPAPSNATTDYIRLRRERYNEAVMDARRDYDSAMADCRALPDPSDRSYCRHEARVDRDQALLDANEQRRTAYLYPATPGYTTVDTVPSRTYVVVDPAYVTVDPAAGHTPADREQRALTRQEQAGGPKP